MGFEKIELSKDAIADLEAKHEDVLVLNGPAQAPWILALRRPTRQECIAFKSHVKRDEATANEQMIRAISVFPMAVDLERQIERWPLFTDAVANSKAYQNFIGYTVEETGK